MIARLHAGPLAGVPLVAAAVVTVATAGALWRRPAGPTSRRLDRVLAFLGFVLTAVPLAAKRHSMRFGAYASAAGSRALAPFRTGTGFGNRVNRATRPLRQVLFVLVTTARKRSFDRLVCGSRAIDALLAPTADLPRPRVTYAERFSALGVTTALGIDDPEEHDPRRAVIDTQIAAAIESGEALLDRIEDAATTRVSGAPGRIDAVADLIVPTCTRAMQVFLGLDVALADEVFQWAQLALHRVFLSPPLPSGARDWLAETSAARAREQLERALLQAVGSFGSLLDDGTAPAGGPLATGHAADPDRVGRLMGYALSLGPHLAWASAYVLDELLRRPAHLEVFVPGPDGEPGDIAEQRHVVLEALRFNPPTSFVARLLSAEVDLVADGTPVRRVGPGVVVVFTGSADFDAGRWRRPLRFDPSRYADGATMPRPYAFSTGIHACPGVDLAPELIVRVLRPLLRTRGLRRASGPDGRLSTRLDRWQPMNETGRWPLPTSLTVTYQDDVPAWHPGDLTRAWAAP